MTIHLVLWMWQPLSPFSYVFSVTIDFFLPESPLPAREEPCVLCATHTGQHVQKIFSAFC